MAQGLGGKRGVSAAAIPRTTTEEILAVNKKYNYRRTGSPKSQMGFYVHPSHLGTHFKR
jgi:hypothetical protein